jgi:hypothetical protein
MDAPHVPNAVVLKAILAKGHNAAHEGVGRTMRRALEAVVDDLVRLNTPKGHPVTPTYELHRERALSWYWHVADGNTEAYGRTRTRRGALGRIADHLDLMRHAGPDAEGFAAAGAYL